MKAIQIYEPLVLKPVDVAEPQKPGPGQALVATHRMGICGTDYSSFLGKFPFFDYPRIPGHELGVEVLDVGEGVTNVASGDRCSVEPYLNCGKCYACRKGNINCCSSLKVIGVMTDGGLCERFLVPAHKLHPSKQLSYEQLSLVETLGIGCHANERANPQPGEHVLIIGAGPIGLSTLEFVKLTGAKISVMDIVESRLEFCKQTYGELSTIHSKGDGSEIELINEITDGDKYSVVFDVTGHNGSMANALNYVANTGTLVYVGVTTSDITFKHPMMHKPEITMKASRNALPSDFTKIIKLIEDGKIDTNPWVTHRTSFTDIVNEFETFTKPESGVIKAVIEVT